jgi:alpha-L-fucosidase
MSPQRAMNIRCLLSSLLAGMVLNLAAPAAPTALEETAAQRDARLAWWREARFGLFVHWGPVSLKGTEIGWSRGAQVPAEEYDQLYRQFNPTNFNAAAWVKVAKDAGMKYLVLTSKHHDGFCLWDTKQSDYNILRSPFGRDVMKELAAACRKQGLRFCAYHSICDWYHPDYPLGSPGGKTPKPNPNMDRYNTYLKAQLAEILQGYGPLGILWFDGEWEKPWTPERGDDLYRFCRELQPSLIINNRVGGGRRGMEGTTAAGAAPGDYDTPEQRVGKFQNDRPWESCITICQQWAWKPDDRMKSLKECLQTLLYCAGGDGNLLFNVGPMPDGRIEPRQVDRLLEMGAWLKKYGRSVYGTRGGPFKPGKWGASTHAGRDIYLHVFHWPPDGLTLPALGRRILSAKVLTGGKASVQQTPEGIRLNVLPGQRQEIDTLLRLTLDGPAGDLKPVSVGPASLTEGKPATASNVFQKQAQHGAKAAVDGDAHTRWATDAGTRQAWLEVDLGRPETFSRVVLDEWEGGGKRVQSFELQYDSGGEWKTFYGGTTIGPNWEMRFGPVTAQRVRLNILEATNGPTFNEFALYAR